MVSRKTVERKVEDLNMMIKALNAQHLFAIEPDSTWESLYEFKPITFNERFIYFEYREIFKTKPIKERFNLNNEDHVEDLRYKFSWFAP